MNKRLKIGLLIAGSATLGWAVSQEFYGQEGPDKFLTASLRQAQEDLRDLEGVLNNKSLTPEEMVLAIREIASRSKRGLRVVSQGVEKESTSAAAVNTHVIHVPKK